MAPDLSERVQRCPNFVSYDSINGPVVYCQIAAFAGRMQPGQLRLIGCTDDVRAACARTMELACGFSAVPVLDVPVRVGDPAADRVAGGGGLAAVAHSRVGGEGGI